MAQKERVTKEELTEDKFISFVMQVYGFVRGQAKALIATGVVIVICLAAVSLYFYQKEQSEQAASLKMGEALAALTEGETNWLDAEKQDESVAKFEEARDGFQAVFGDHSSSSYADEALFYHGKALAYLKQYDEAVSSFQKLVNEHPNSLFALHGQYSIGQVLAQKGQTADLQRAVSELAPERFTRFAKLPLQEREQVQMVALLQRALYFERLNQLENALKSCEQVTETFEANLQQLVMQRSREATQQAKALLETIQSDLVSVDDTVRQEMDRAKAAESQGNYFAALDAYVTGIHMYRIIKENQDLDPQLREQMMTFEKRMNAFLKGIKDARKREDEGRLTGALYNYEQALGGLTFAPTREIFEKASAKSDQLHAQIGGPQYSAHAPSADEASPGTQN